MGEREREERKSTRERWMRNFPPLSPYVCVQERKKLHVRERGKWRSSEREGSVISFSHAKRGKLRKKFPSQGDARRKRERGRENNSLSSLIFLSISLFS